MNKKDLMEILRQKSNLTRNESKITVNLFFDEIVNALEKGDRVEIRGLCTFFVKEYESYNGRNPRTGETVKVVPKKLPYFKCGQELKRRVDY